MMIHVGVDLHQRFCYCTAVKASGEVIGQRSVVNEAESLQRYMRSLPQPVQVVVEACGFWPAFKQAIEKDVARLVMVHPPRVKAIASARLKTIAWIRRRWPICRVAICCRKPGWRTN